MSDRAVLFGAALIALLGVHSAGAQPLTGPALVQALRQGGYVLLMRHAHAPTALPDAAHAAPGNTHRERQLDAAGRASAVKMGAALRALRIPIGTVLSSPTYRARETLRLAGFPNPKTAVQLGDGGASMSPAAVAAWASWLKMTVAKRPRAGTDTLIVTHTPNIASAFPAAAKGMTDGEALVLHPGGRTAKVVAHVTIDTWPKLAATR